MEGATIDREGEGVAEPTARMVLAALALATVGMVATRVPVWRPSAFDFDEVGYLETIAAYRFPMHHTLFLAAARAVGEWVGNSYRGFLILDMAVSALALVGVWWWLRALVRPATAAAATLVLGSAPVFWSYGAMAGNYTAIPLVGSILLGLAVRGARAPRRWHPFAAAAVLAIGTGYRQDIGTFWMPVFLVVLWQHRWLRSAWAGVLFGALNLAWALPMLRDVGGWDAYRAASREFAYNAGYLNSVWNLGVIDAPVRYAVKGGMALAWTLGPGLLLVPFGLVRLARRPRGVSLGALLALSMLPALASHLLIHFGVAGYAFHYVPALLALAALGAGHGAAAPRRLAALAALLAAVFLLYPTDYDHPGVRGNFDLAFARHTRVALRTRPPLRDPSSWRTVNSQELPGGGRRASARRTSLSEILAR
ncbi:MAG TPA: glycosyltransferase family 39 protein [Isosphaeraceae bacterium]|jgi:hypothetical protein|nr:glycosyltransferase family 39 protein [Isosphaeraceae bacterium]